MAAFKTSFWLCFAWHFKLIYVLYRFLRNSFHTKYSCKFLIPQQKAKASHYITTGKRHNLEALFEITLDKSG